jgi:hypothetical protein
MTESVTQEYFTKALDWAYDSAVDGVPGLDSAQELTENYAAGDGSLLEKANSLIRWQIAKAATSGFLTGLGGILAMPVAIPANLASVMYVQIRMIAAIAHLGGHDLRDDKVRTLVYMCLIANAAKDIFKDAGIVVGTKVATQAIKNISRETIVGINKKAGFRLLTKFGEKGVINLGKAIPLIGGLIGGTLDAAATKAIGNVARDTFVDATAP